jgi:hypothetical protein
MTSTKWNGLAMKLLEYPCSYVAGFLEKLTVEIGQDGRAARILLLLTMQQLSPRDQRRHRQQQVVRGRTGEEASKNRSSAR